MISMTFPQMRRCECGVNGKVVKLTRAQTAVLALLLIRRGKVVTTVEIWEALWSDWEEGMAPYGKQIVGQTMMRLRKRIGYDEISTAIAGPNKGGYTIPLPPTDAQVWAIAA